MELLEAYWKLHPEVVQSGDQVMVEIRIPKTKWDSFGTAVSAPDPSKKLFRLDLGSPDATLRASFDQTGAPEAEHIYMPQSDTEAVLSKWILHTTNLPAGGYGIRLQMVVGTQTFTLSEKTESEKLTPIIHYLAIEKTALDAGENLSVSLSKTNASFTADLPLWLVILKSTEKLSFNHYQKTLDEFFCGNNGHSLIAASANSLNNKRALPFVGVDAYRQLKIATEAFLQVNCAVDLKEAFSFDLEKLREIEEVMAQPTRSFEDDRAESLWNGYLEDINGTSDPTIPYLALVRQKLSDERIKPLTSVADTPFGDNCAGIIQNKFLYPCFLELIWSYWHEESMMVQGMTAIGRRFQNIRSQSGPQPLAHVNTDTLRPLNNLLWGYIQDEQHRLSVKRRAYEYDYQYGITLQGKAVSELNSVESRTRFLGGFHRLLNLCAQFFRQEDDTTVIPDGYPLLNALKEVHLILSEGAHNQFGDLPYTARMEMMMQQYILARPEFREFLPTRIMVTYQEPWMDRVSALNSLHSWTDTSITHFRNLGVFGEQLLLSIRYGAWNTINDSQPCLKLGKILAVTHPGVYQCLSSSYRRGSFCRTNLQWSEQYASFRIAPTTISEKP